MAVKNFSDIIEDSMTETKALFVFTEVIELVLGIFLIIYPEVGSTILTMVLGGILAGVGIFNIISSLMNKESTFRQGILPGVICTALGIAFIAQAETVVNVTSIILGVFVIFEGLTCCKRAVIMKRLEFSKWFIPLIAALVTCVFGGLILLFPSLFSSAVMIVTGVILSVEAVLGIVSIIMIMRFRKKFQEKIEESEKLTVSEKNQW